MKTILFILVSFIAFTATLSGVLMISNPDGSFLNLHLTLLESTPFKDYFLPGILLAALVGLVNLLAVFFIMLRHPNRYYWAMAGGFMVSGWILIQLLLIRAGYWLHMIYFFFGLFIILIAYQLKGKWAV